MRTQEEIDENLRKFKEEQALSSLLDVLKKSRLAEIRIERDIKQIRRYMKIVGVCYVLSTLVCYFVN